MSSERSVTRGTMIEVWQEPTGYWSVRVEVRIPARPDWREFATALHNADEALAWAQERIDLAVASAS